jgi:hypothetical protein
MIVYKKLVLKKSTIDSQPRQQEEKIIGIALRLK